MNHGIDDGRVKRLTLSEIVLCAAVASVFGAVLYPIVAQARSASRHDLFVANLKTLSASTLQYAEDFDGVLPFGFPQRADGSWYWQYRITIPAGWDPNRPWNGSEWPNSVQPYFLDWKLLEFPGLPEVGTLPKEDYENANFPWANSAVGYNGLLHSYPLAMITAPESLTMIWTNQGRGNQDGYVVPNPSLDCDQDGPCQYVPMSPGCSADENGQQSRMFSPSASVWVDRRSSLFASIDGHVRSRRLGNVLTPGDTDFHIDPYTGYEPTGLPQYFWWDGCHVWLFRPDYDFSN